MTDSRSDLVDQLAKLASLRDSGALTQTEFETAKARVLGSAHPDTQAPGAGAQGPSSVGGIKEGTSSRSTSGVAYVERVDFNERMSLTAASVAAVAELLLSKQKIRPAEGLQATDVPSSKGIYAFFRGSERMWIGKATGQHGLRGRIIRQHLNPQYLDARPRRFSSDRVLVTPDGRQAVDSSYLRRKLGRIPSLNLSPGAGTVAYIRQNMSVAWVTFGPEWDAKLIARVERAIIDMLKPTLND
jgi:hypothetical protein